MQSYRDTYRTKDKQADYTFSFEEQSDGTWRAYIVSQPSYQGRAEGAHDTHRLTDNGRRYVCWDKPVRSFADMKKIAAAWADCTQFYITHGRFPGPADV